MLEKVNGARKWLTASEKSNNIYIYMSGISLGKGIGGGRRRSDLREIFSGTKKANSVGKEKV